MDHVRRFPDKSSRPDHILWDGIAVQTYDWWDVPENGIVAIELLSAEGGIRQGVDVKLEDGAIKLPNGDSVSLLRTWKDDRFEDALEYPFHSRARRLCVWNVFERCLPNSETTEEKWTGNSGFWIERVGNVERIYHCSHGMAEKPDFDLFRFKIGVRPLLETR